MKQLLIVLVAPVFVLSAWNRSEATAITSTLSLQADAAMGSATDTDTASQSQVGTINALTASADALAVDGASSVEATATATATWTDANNGTVAFSDLGWAVNNPSDLQASADLTGGLDYSYTFIADATGTFTLNYAITGASNSPELGTFGLQGFLYTFDGNTSFLGVNSSGTFSAPVIAGNTYTFQLANGANLYGSLPTYDALMAATFDFGAPSGVAAVPEPASLTLLGLGLAGVGLRRWRHRKA